MQRFLTDIQWHILVDQQTDEQTDMMIYGSSYPVLKNGNFDIPYLQVLIVYVFNLKLKNLMLRLVLPSLVI